MKTVQIKRGCHTWQWMTVPGAFMTPQPMEKQDLGDDTYQWRGVQVAMLHDVPEGLTNTQIMIALGRAAWMPGSHAFTELHWRSLEGGWVEFVDGAGNRVGIA